MKTETRTRLAAVLLALCLSWTCLPLLAEEPVLELKNVRQEDVMIWPRGAIIYPEVIVEGKGVVEPNNLMSCSGKSSARCG